MTNSIKSEDVTPSGVIFDSTAQTNDDYRGSRPAWNRQLDFIFSLIGYAVGVGNIWRFPNLCYRNGGGAFLIPYSLMLFACGIPLFFLEVSLGQFSNKGAIKVWDICPLFRGVGIGTLVITTICNVYYNLLIAFILFYLFSSFTSMLPWSQCNHKWNSPSCIVLKDQVHRNETMIGDLRSKSTSTFEFWHYKVLNISEGLHHMGSINWKLAGYFILAWTIAYLCLIKGIKSTGKIVYFTATFPYVMLTILLIRSLLLPGAFNGILYFIRPNWKLGSQRFVDDIQCMLEGNLKGALVWKILWSVVNPIILCTIIVSNILYHVPIKYGNYIYPQWSIRMGWAISCFSLIPIPIYAICYLYCFPGETFIKRLKMSLRPSEWDSIRSAKARPVIRFELLPKEIQ
ncbi:sodium- and chloride-dependent glycine transporter 2-like [Gordionus sp. m RMFG-2023]|uniref:sodium- and chloride-dependent glycine transporter 2-like n=1 Tax=Gordionus sp. m RMFG-2023 TaxID=3053472 RepID=UPI0031FD2A60